MTCVWEVDSGCLGDAWDDLDPDVQDRSVMLASSSLQALTYYRVGTCPITIRPCPQSSRRCRCAWNPHPGGDGFWYNSCEHRTLCEPLSEYVIPGPVGYIEKMLINGEEIDVWDATQWRLDNGNRLVWQGEGLSPLPTSQDLNLPDTEPGTWSITYSQSYPVLEDGRLAMTMLAMEFAKACAPKGKCSLPKGVTNVVRNGVSFTIEAGLFPGGLTGNEITDQFILKWAPAGMPQRSAQVFDPTDMSAPRRTTSVPRKVVI